MALTLSRVAPSYVVGNRRQVEFDVTFDSSNPDDGEALTPANVGLKVIESAEPHGPFMDSGNDNAILVRYDVSEQKLVPFWGNGDTAGALPEVTAETDLSGYSGRVTFRGR